jgi:DNA (cytosine-5)-methyltransferase 1
MYEELVNKLTRDSISRYPDLKTNPDLQAAISHWLNNEDVNFVFKEPDLIQLWVSIRNAFCDNNGVIVADLLQTISFRADVETFDFIDLFAGIGGFRLALQSNGGRCVFSSEWDKSAKITYFKNHGEYPFGDINRFTGSDVTDHMLDELIPDHRLLAGGFPCQPFSHAGVSARTSLGIDHGFNCKTQGTLFHSIARVAYVKQPEVVFMENVRNIVTHDSGETFSTIRETMENLSNGEIGKYNYVFHHAVINSDTIVAQRRIRCFMVCIRQDIWEELGQQAFEFPLFDGEIIPLRNALDELTPDEALEYTISDKLWSGHIRRTQRNLDRNTGFTAHLANLDRPSNTIVARYGKDGKECLIPQENSNPRKLTKNECAKLFGYPEGFWTPAAKTPTYKQFGNSVVVPVVTRIAESIIDYLDN